MVRVETLSGVKIVICQRFWSRDRQTDRKTEFMPSEPSLSVWFNLLLKVMGTEPSQELDVQSGKGRRLLTRPLRGKKQKGVDRKWRERDQWQGRSDHCTCVIATRS